MNGDRSAGLLRDEIAIDGSAHDQARRCRTDDLRREANIAGHPQSWHRRHPGGIGIDVVTEHEPTDE